MLKPEGGVLIETLKSQDSFILPPQYNTVFWSIVAIIFLLALIIAVRTPPSEAKTGELRERQAIKGLRPFTSEDAEIFRSLQRESSLERCLKDITYENFRFGILIGLSGCGKTSFLQAGLIPRLPNYKHHGVYVRFDSGDPLTAIHKALAQQLEIPLDWLNSRVGDREIEPGTSFLQLLTQAVKVAGSPVVLFLDQFEQWFVHYQQRSERETLLQGLTKWYSNSDGLAVKIVVSIRSDLSYLLHHELIPAMNCSLGFHNTFVLEKFTPQQATQVLKTIAQTEKLAFDEGFLAQLSKEELANQEDGLISPVDLQILAWIVTAQNTQQLRAFNRKAFQKFGGVEELMSRYLEKALLARGIKTQREAAVKVLLALTDLDRQVRCGVLTLEELEAKLNSTVPREEIIRAVNWLKRGDVRLITPVRTQSRRVRLRSGYDSGHDSGYDESVPEEKESAIGYELAHERLIPAILKQGDRLRLALRDRELTVASRANRLLERRVNEWLGNNRSSRYLFSFWELLLIEKQKPDLGRGSKRKQKQRLLALSRVRIYGVVGIVISLVLVVLGFLGWLWFTPQGQIQQVRWSIDNPFSSSLERVDDDIAVQAPVAIAKEGKWQYAFKLVREKVQNDEARRDFLSEFSKVVGRDDSNQAQAQLKQALVLAKEIENPYNQSEALRAIAFVYGQIGDDLAAGKVLKESLNAAKEVEEPYYQSLVLREIASVYTQRGDDLAAGEVLKNSLKAAKKIKDPEDQSEILREIASAYRQIGDDLVAGEGLKNSLKAAKKIKDPEDQSEILKEIASVYGQIGDDSVAGEILKESLNAAKEIEDPYDQSWVLSEIASAYGQLKDDSVAREGLKESLNAAKEIEDPYDQSWVLSEIASAYGQLKDDSVAREGLKESLNAAKEIEDPYDQSWVLSEIASAYGQLKDDSVAREGLKESLNAAKEIKDPSSQSEVLREIASAYGQIGDDLVAREGLKESFNAAKEIEDPYDQSEVLIGIASVYRKIGDDLVAGEVLKESLNAAKKIKDSSYQSRVLSNIASVYGQIGDDLVAGEGLKESLKAAKEIEDPKDQSEVLREIALVYGQIGDDLAAGEGLKESLNAAKEIEDLSYQSRVLREIALVYGQLEDDSVAGQGLKDSLNAAKEIDSNRDNLFKDIIAATRNINNPNIRQSILQDILLLAEADNANEALAEISYQ